MEGPTPVSALIHAATLVVAGVFLIIRCSLFFENSDSILVVVSVIGSLTSFFAASVGLFQNDLKRVIAYSTCSQLGYMIFISGLSHYSVSLFHLANHAVFKALLFLGAGCVIHGLSDEQDLRKMGGLLNLFPLSYVMMFIGSLALVGFPFLTGFYSFVFSEEFWSFAPHPPKITLKKDLFIPLHIIYERIAPDDPTKAPVIISAVFSKVNPIPAAAQPE
jgi:NADH-ubiquinone oxidoreductase chain 5